MSPVYIYSEKIEVMQRRKTHSEKIEVMQRRKTHHNCHIQSNARERLLCLKMNMLDPSLAECIVHFAFTGLKRRIVGLHVIQNVRSTNE